MSTSVVRSASERLSAVVAHRPRLVALALSRGAGDEAEDVAQEALLRVALRRDVDLERVAPYLSKVVANLCNDLHRRARAGEVLAVHRGLHPRERGFDETLCDRAEAQEAAVLLGKVLPSDLLEVAYRLAHGATSQQVADGRGESEPALRARLRRAFLQVRREVGQWRR